MPPPPFDQLAESRRRWIHEVLQPWCREAALRDLRRAELEWADIAGRVDPQATLWTWAWGRFPVLVSEGISGVDETSQVMVTLRSGSTLTGYPDARQSRAGQLVLVGRDDGGQAMEWGPVSIDDIVHVVRT